MVQVHIDNELHARLKVFVENNRLDYPTIKYAINQAVKEFLARHQNQMPARTLNTQRRRWRGDGACGASLLYGGHKVVEAEKHAAAKA